MTSQDRQRVSEIIKQAEEKPQVICLDDYGAVIFRNIYNEATIAKLTVTILERGKIFQIGKANDKDKN